MYNNALSFIIVSGNKDTENVLRDVQPLEDSSYSFRTVGSIEEAESGSMLDTAVIFDCTGGNALPANKKDGYECAAILPSESPELAKAETVSRFGDIWMMPDGKLDAELIRAYFSRLAVKMKTAADSRKQGICFYTLIDSVPDIAWYKDTVGSHLIVNDSFCKLVGKSKEQIYKKGHCFIWDATPEDEEVCLSSDRMIMESRKTNTFEEEVVTKSDKLLLKSYKSALIDENGEVFGTCGIARDVTEFKNATTEIQILLDSIPYVVLLEDADETVMSKNMQFDGYFPEFKDIVGKSSEEWKKSLNINTSILSASNQKEAAVMYNGNERTLLIDDEPLLDIFYHTCGKIITLVDITDERNIAKELEESKQKAQEANRAKSLFLANMSHEIRTPINSVIGMNEMILRESNEQEIRNYALNSRRSAKMLLGLINDILDFSKIESGKMELTPAKYAVSEVITDVANMMLSRAHDKGLSLKINVDPELPSVLYGDDVKLRQIITNLLTNAVKYTKEGSVTVTASGTVSDGKLAFKVSVSDTGLGIKPEDLKNIFDAFLRVDDVETRRIEGTGLGLNITNRFLTMMGSKLEVASEYGKGSDFFFTVMQEVIDPSPVGNIEISVEQADGFAYSASFAAPEAKILMVDDNDMNRAVFRGLLKQTRVQVSEAESGYECLNMIKKERFDIIFLDHMMPGMDGIETFHHIKDDDNLCKDVPVIALTANAISGARETYMSEGFANFLSKPISPTQLEKMIVNYLPKELIKEAADYADAPKSALPEIEGFNFEIARLYAKNDETIKASLEMFGDNLVKSIALLSYYLPVVEQSDENLDLFRIQAHSLKGTAAIVGAAQVSELAKTAEYAAKAKDIGRIKALTPILIEETKACLKKVEDAGIYKKKPPCPEDLKLADKVKEIISLTEEFRMDEADEIMNELYGYSYPDDIQVQIEILKIAEVNCDIETLIKISENI